MWYKTADTHFQWAAEHHVSAGDDGGEKSLHGEVGASVGGLRAHEADKSSLKSGYMAPRQRKDAKTCESL